MRSHQLGAPRPEVNGAGWRVMVVESDVKEREHLTNGLRRIGHEVEPVESGEAAVRACANVDIILLDLDLPDVDGLEVCRGIRAISDVAMIAVTRCGTELERVLGLQAGVDDYVVKPYGFRELAARMDAVMRRARPQPPAAQVITWGPLCIDADLRRVTVGGRQVEVTRKEFDLLHLLASRPGTVVSRKQIMQQVWGDSWSRRTVDTHVSSLRNKLGGREWIITVRGVGFRLGHG